VGEAKPSKQRTGASIKTKKNRVGRRPLSSKQILKKTKNKGKKVHEAKN